MQRTRKTVSVNQNTLNELKKVRAEICVRDNIELRSLSDTIMFLVESWRKNKMVTREGE